MLTVRVKARVVGFVFLGSTIGVVHTFKTWVKIASVPKIEYGDTPFFCRLGAHIKISASTALRFFAASHFLRYYETDLLSAPIIKRSVEYAFDGAAKGRYVIFSAVIVRYYLAHSVTELFEMASVKIGIVRAASTYSPVAISLSQ